MKKKVKIILIVIASIVVLCVMFAIVDYNRTLNGKKPMFMLLSYSFSSFDVEVAGEESHTENTEGLSYTVYSGLGYKIAVCDGCENPVNFMPFGIGTEPQSALTCTKENGYNDKEILQYIFKDGKVETIYTTRIVPAKNIEDEESYRSEFEKINEVDGCSGGFTKDINLSGDVSYETNQYCNLGEMSDNDIKLVYGKDFNSIRQTIKEVIKENNNMKCEKES